jgi:hypothetical protein
MPSLAHRQTLAQRLGLDHVIIAVAGEPQPMIKDRWTYRELDWDCPHCGFPVHFVLLDSANSDDRFDNAAAGIEEKTRNPEFGYMDKTVYLVCRCPRSECRGIVFAIADGRRQISAVYPYTRATADGFDRSIPHKIRDDFAEATRTFYASAFKSCVVMCRRVVQDIAKDKNISGDTNKQVIKAMHDSGLITKPMFDAAHEIRHYGGYGAHPQDDGLDDITPEIAESLLELTNQFLQNIYVMEGKNAALAKKRQQVKQP